MTNLNAVKTGVMNLMSGSAFETSISRIYYAQAPKEAAYPYAVFSLPDIEESRDSGDKFSEFTVNWFIFTANSSSESGSDFAAQLKAVFDDSEGSLVISGQRVRKVTKEFEDEFPALDSQEFSWAYFLRYLILIH